MKTSGKLAIFDFDHTLTTKDTTFLFMYFVGGKTKSIYAFVKSFPFLLLALFKFYNWSRLKEKIFKAVFGGMGEAQLDEYGHKFSKKIIPEILNGEVYGCLNRYRQDGFEIVLLSASCSVWLRHWCAQEGIRLISTELEVVDGKITGSLQGKNCYGAEKLKRLEADYDLKQYTEIVAYGNHRSDLHYMKIADRAFMVNGRQIHEL